MMTVYWLIGTAVLLLIEMITISLTSIWFAGGALAAAIVSVFSANIIIQVAVFIAVSIVLLAITRPIAVKYVNAKVEKTNVDALVGRRCKVATTIDPANSTGKIIINDVEWGARSADGESVIPQGTEVQIKEISGVKLVVEPIEGLKEEKENKE
ncbi:MAG: NfeD family protein [Lachnospiraceae bacterium]|nr:NfeD family protein [Lachnospiraceae bacterium]